MVTVTIMHTLAKTLSNGTWPRKKPPPGGGCCADANQAVASDLQLTLYSFVVVVLQAILVAYHLAIQLVYQFIHSGVQV